jgi:DNA recombination-dependent growth factor C
MAARSHEAPETAAEHSAAADDEAVDDADDLLAGLRDSLQAMESVAAEMERAPEVGTTDETLDTTATAQQAIAGGARIVPLRSSDP